MIRKLALAAALFMASGYAAAYAQDAAGYTLHKRGHAEVQRNAQAIGVSEGDPIVTGDRLVTLFDGYLEALLADESAMVMRPSSELSVLANNYSPESQKGDIRLALSKGGVRIVSGSASHSGQSRFVIETSQGAVSPQGTDFISFICAGDCAAIDESMADGLYVSVAEGAVQLVNSAGSLSVPAGSVAFAANDQTAPAIVNINLAALEGEYDFTFGGFASGVEVYPELTNGIPNRPINPPGPPNNPPPNNPPPVIPPPDPPASPS